MAFFRCGEVTAIANTLNERQEQFCQAIIQGKSQRQAYYTAYPKSKAWKPENVDKRASELVNSAKVLPRLAELRAEIEKQNEVSRNGLIAQLKSIGFADLDIENIRPTDKIKAIEVMAKLLGYDRPEIAGADTREDDPLSNSLKHLAATLDEGSG